MESASSIVAIATPPGTGGIAIIRISGPEAITITAKVWKGADLAAAASHTAHLGTIVDSDGQAIDQVVATVFRAPGSYTGENTVEISCHGAPYIQQQIVRTLIEAGATAAGPGEFTRRAFFNGRLDLAQAEGVADLIAASSAASHRQALRQTTGQFSKAVGELRDALTHFAAMLELELDFSEEDVEFASRRHLLDLAIDARERISTLADTFRAGRVFRDGLPVAIAGIPNAGKSTLLNALVGDDRAITSAIAGTTRDTIEASATIGGILCRIIDTAGLRNSADPIETLGIERAYRAINSAAIVLWLIDPTVPLNNQIETMLRTGSDLQPDSVIIPLITKSDIVTTPCGNEVSEIIARTQSTNNIHIDTPLAISAATGENISNLRKIIEDKALQGTNPETDLIVTNERHYNVLRSASADLDRVISSLRHLLTPTQDTLSPSPINFAPSHISPAYAIENKIGNDDGFQTHSLTNNNATIPAANHALNSIETSINTAIDPFVSTDLIAEDLRQAISHLSEITGAITTHAVLSHLFSSFCIGK